MEAAFDAKKACLACQRLIPHGAIFCADCHQFWTAKKPGRLRSALPWIAAATAIIVLSGSLIREIRLSRLHRHSQSDLKARLAIADTQLRRGEYQAVIQTTENILQTHPQSIPAADDQIAAAMLLVEALPMPASAGDSRAGSAANNLDAILPILDAGLARSRGQGQHTAEVLAHIGWAHWLNPRITRRESAPAAEEDMQSALAIDETNPYANAMLGNILLRSGGGFHEALDYFAAALNSGKARPLVRRMQLDGLTGAETPAARAELIKAVNDMRLHGEPLDPELSRRILTFVSDPAADSQTQLADVLSAISPDEFWATYLWLDGTQNKVPGNTDTAAVERSFLHAEILEFSGKDAEALEEYRQLRLQKNLPPQFSVSIGEAIQRLS